MNKTKQNESEEQITPEKKWKTATIANNFIFYKIMRHNPDVCTELLEILLEMEIDHIEMHGEETIETDFGSKVIRMLSLFVFLTFLKKVCLVIVLKTYVSKIISVEEAVYGLGKTKNIRF